MRSMRPEHGKTGNRPVIDDSAVRQGHDLAGIGLTRVRLFYRWNRVGAAEPAVQIDFPAAFGAERPAFRALCLAAGRARRAVRFLHRFEVSH